MAGCKRVQMEIFELGTYAKTFFRDEGRHRIFQYEVIRQYFDIHKLEEIIRCRCMADWCCGQLQQPERDELLGSIARIRKNHVLMAGLLARRQYNLLLLRWIRKGPTDQHLELNWIQEKDVLGIIRDNDSTENGRIAMIAEDIVRDQTVWFFRLMSVDTLDIQAVPWSRLLPFKFDDAECQRSPTARVCVGVQPMNSMIGQDGTPIKSLVAKIFKGSELNPDIVSGPRREIDVAQRLISHKNVIKPIAVLRYEDWGILLFEEAYGDFAKVMSEKRYSFSEIDVLQIFEGMAAGIRHTHTNAMQHLDIKPENMLLLRRDESVACLTDFGSSADWDFEEDSVSGSSSKGDRDPPENQNGTTSNSTDIWRFGTVGIDFLVWHTEDVEGLEKFHEERRVNHTYGANSNISVQNARPYCHDGKLHDAVDRAFDRLNDRYKDDPIMFGVVSVVKETLNMIPEGRPSAIEIHRKLQRLFRSQQIADAATNSSTPSSLSVNS